MNKRLLIFSKKKIQTGKRFFLQDGITQEEWPDHDAQYDFPPHQVGITYSEKPACEPENSCEATSVFHIPAPFIESYIIM
jgi:hypothetical protein